MARKQTYRGKTIEELQVLSLEEFIKLVPSHQRRTLKHMSTKIKKFLEALKKKKNKPVKTHVREMVIVPQMVGLEFLVYNGKEWVKVIPGINMLGQRLGSFSITTKLVKHSGPGIGATRGSKAVELK
ncbi:ribosomal protein S19 family protein [Candidatus Micrarchaeota archaeon]|nr:ribosomal protein S19 family protein [Candidatus Micrarchaeota archaeon]